MSGLYQYSARGRGGQIERGRVDAPTRADALTRLRGRGLTPLELQPVSSAQRATLSDRAARDLAKTLSQLLASGLSLSQALRFAGEELDGVGASAALHIQEAVARGDRPSNGLTSFEGGQARLLRGVLIAGETSGKLSHALDVAAKAFEQSTALRARLVTAAIYPAFVIAATLATLSVFLLFVAPALGQAFEGNDDKLPEATRALLALSAWLRAHGLVLLAAIVAIPSFIAVYQPARETAVLGLHHLALAPISGGIAPRLEFSAFARLSSLALSAGVPSAAALEAGAAGLQNTLLRARLARAVSAIRVGERPSQALALQAKPPRTLQKLMQVGEETGRLAEAMANAADLLAAEAEHKLERVGAIAGPIITLTLGALVGSVVLSLYLGLMAMSDVAAL